MKTTARIPMWRTLVNWIITVITGSILWPVLGVLVEGRSAVAIGEAGPVMLISMVLSALCSIPALILLLVINGILNKQEVTLVRYKTIHHAIHFFLGILTFFVIMVFAGLSNPEYELLSLLGLVYIAVGMLCWEFVFQRARRAVKETPKEDNDLLDEPEAI